MGSGVKDPLSIENDDVFPRTLHKATVKNREKMVVSLEEKNITRSDSSENVLGVLIGYIVSTLVAIPKTLYNKERRGQKAHGSHREEGPGSNPLAAVDETNDPV